MKSRSTGTSFQHCPDECCQSSVSPLHRLTYFPSALASSQADFLHMVKKTCLRGRPKSSYLRRKEVFLLLGFILNVWIRFSLTHPLDIMPNSEPIPAVLWCTRLGCLLLLWKEDGTNQKITHQIEKRHLGKQSESGGKERRIW